MIQSWSVLLSQAMLALEGLRSNELFQVVEISVMVGIIFFIYLGFYIAFWQHKGMFQACGFGRLEVYLLLVGGVIGTVSNLPLIIGDNVLLAINIGGGIVPVVISVYLIWSKRFNIAFTVVGVALISALAYHITTLVPGLGVVTGFPDFLYPSVASAGLALLLYQRNTEMGAPFAYMAATLGNLIGADIIRIPQILGLGAGTMASMGGAGARDMVFMSGLLAFLMVIPFSKKALWSRKEEKRGVDKCEHRIRKSTAKAHILALSGNFKGALDYYIDSLETYIEEIVVIYKISPEKEGKAGREEIFQKLNVNPHITEDYMKLDRLSKSGNIWDTMKAIYTIRNIIRNLSFLERRIYAPITKRVIAFLIDLAIIWLVIFIISIAILAITLDILFIITLVVFWMLVMDVIYFTFFESIWGKTPGKHMLGIEVMNDHREKPTFMEAFARNVFRIADKLLLFYLISLVLMALDPKVRRIGDKLAGTIVVKSKSTLEREVQKEYARLYPRVWGYYPHYTPYAHWGHQR